VGHLKVPLGRPKNGVAKVGEEEKGL